MNAKEFSEKIGVNEKTVRNMIKRGDLKATKIGKSFKIDENQAKDMILENRLDSHIGSTLGAFSASVAILEKDKQDIFDDILKTLTEVTESNDKSIAMDKFDNSSVMEKISMYDVINKEIINLTKTIKFISSKYKEERKNMLNQLSDDLNK